MISIEPCSEIEDGLGRIVTATFRHSVADVLDIYTTAHDEPIGTTPNHPFWSVDRQDWVQAGSLEVGEHLQLRDGRLDEVITLLPHPGPHAVYNLTVEGTHTYHVGEGGVLVHNATRYGSRTPIPTGYERHHIIQDARARSIAGSSHYPGTAGGPDSCAIGAALAVGACETAWRVR